MSQAYANPAYNPQGYAPDAYQAGANPYAAGYPSGYDPYAAGYPGGYDPAYQQDYQGYPAGYSTAGTTAQSTQASTADAAAGGGGSSMSTYCMVICIFYVVFMFCCVAFVIILNRTDTKELTEGDVYGGGSSSGGGSSAPAPPAAEQRPAVKVGDMTMQPVIVTVMPQPQTSPLQPVITNATQTGGTPPTTLRPPPPVHTGAAPPMPLYTYICTVSEPVRGNDAYLPPDGACDYLFYDSVYKYGQNSLLSGIGRLNQGVQHFITHASKYAKTKFGLSFAPEPVLLRSEYKNRTFYDVIDALWNSGISHFGFLDLYKQYTIYGMVSEALTVLKAIHNHLLPRTSASRPSYHVVGMSIDGTTYDQTLGLMKTLFTPSMFISIAHLSYSVKKFRDCRIFPVALDYLPQVISRGRDYSYGHTVNESVAVLRTMESLGFTIPLAISFSLKGVYYSPKLSNPSSPSADEFDLYKPCQDFGTDNYDDPKLLCLKKGWQARFPLPQMAYSVGEKRVITYLTETRVATMACEVKQVNLKLQFALAAYDVDYDHAPPCTQFGFSAAGGSYNRLMNMRQVMDYMRYNYTTPRKNFECQTLSIGFSFG